MAYDFVVTNPLSGKQKTLQLSDTVQNALRLKHTQEVSFYNADAEQQTMASLLGLNYPQIESLRRSPEFDREVETFISMNSETLTDTPELRAKLGVMGPERLTRASKSALTKANCQLLGEQFVERLVVATQPLEGENTFLSVDYAAMVLGEYVFFSDSLPPLPEKPVKPKAQDKTAALEAEVESLRQQLREMGGTPRDESDG